MAATYTLISSSILSTAAGSFTFSSIPTTYNNLLIKTSTRASGSDYRIFGALRFNSDTANNYSDTYLEKADNTPLSSRHNDISFSYNIESPAALATADVFNSGEIYIPNYTLSEYKQYSEFTVGEIATTLNQHSVSVADLWRNTAAITSITLFPGGGWNFVSGSSFYLYGIKNS